MRTGLIVLILLIAAPAAHAQGPGSLQERSANWGGIAKCVTSYDQYGEFITETCRTIKYCKARQVRNKRGKVVRYRIEWCTRTAPWLRGTRTG